MEPGGARNISQSLFLVDEKLSKCSNGLELNELNTPESWFSPLAKPDGLGCQKPAYINQSRISTWYQDNGSQELIPFSNQFGLSPMGGQYNLNDKPGARPNAIPSKVPKPGYALYNNEFYKVQNPTPVAIDVKQQKGISIPSFMNFFSSNY